MCSAFHRNAPAALSVAQADGAPWVFTPAGRNPALGLVLQLADAGEETRAVCNVADGFPRRTFRRMLGCRCTSRSLAARAQDPITRPSLAAAPDRLGTGYALLVTRTPPSSVLVDDAHDTCRSAPGCQLGAAGGEPGRGMRTRTRYSMYDGAGLLPSAGGQRRPRRF